MWCQFPINPIQSALTRLLLGIFASTEGIETFIKDFAVTRNMEKENVMKGKPELSDGGMLVTI